uniref:Uncharacterized protein n=1 Tax=Oryza brachyantha TaxID=4533 RepID=J3M5M9_ORYBR
EMSSEKSSWPEVVGLPAEAAEQMILHDQPDVHVVVLRVGSVVTTEINPKRVRVFTNISGSVAQVPKIG